MGSTSGGSKAREPQVGDYYRLPDGRVLHVRGREHYEVDGRVLWTWDIRLNPERCVETRLLFPLAALLQDLNGGQLLTNLETIPFARAEMKLRRAVAEAQLVEVKP